MDFLSDSPTLSAAAHALSIILSFDRLIFLIFGVLVGIALGLIPGIGGLTGFALLVPFTYTMDPYAAFAMLLGMHSVIATSDVLTAVLFGVPGASASQATVLDGLAMTKKGQASRALAACYTSSLFGGLIGALVLAVMLPLIRPVVLSIATPEMLALTIFGVAMVSVLSGQAPLKGVAAACLGILIGMVGTNVQTGQERWTGGLLYLQEGIPLVPMLLGIFALPELCDLAIQRTAMAEGATVNVREGMRQGIGDVLKNWLLVLRCGGIGAFLGMIPGITGAVADWIIYGHAMATLKGAKDSFTKGDVRGVIAPESGNNAREGGMLVPMLAFGVPGGAVQAILLGALMVHGFTAGPDMLTKHLDLTYSMVWSIALANIFGTVLCFTLSGYLARVATLRHSLILPVILPIVLVGAYQASRSWGDLMVVLAAGVLGWTMKRLKWARPPLILGLVLGMLLERYMSISFMRYDTAWLMRPGVVVLLSLAGLVFFGPLIKMVRGGGLSRLPGFRFEPRPEDIFHVLVVCLGAYMLITAQEWHFMAKIGPTVVAGILVLVGTISLLNKVFLHPSAASKTGTHMDLAGQHDEPISTGLVLTRAARFFGWFIAFQALTGLLGMLPAVPLVMVAFMRVEGRESWRLSVILALCVMAFMYGIFDQVLHVEWPDNLLGQWRLSAR
jgi:TctA family transporter